MISCPYIELDAMHPDLFVSAPNFCGINFVHQIAPSHFGDAPMDETLWLIARGKRLPTKSGELFVATLFGKPLSHVTPLDPEDDREKGGRSPSTA